MIIVMIWQCVYPWDIRIEKIINLLSRQGYKVHLICRGKKGDKPEEQINSAAIHRILVSFPAIGAAFSQVLSYPLFFNPVWIYKAVRILIRKKADVIIIRDLPLALLGGVLGKILKKTVILDMAENYPAALIAYSKTRYKPFLFMNGLLPRLYERLSLQFVDHVFVVAEEQKNRLIKLGIPGNRISCVLNTPELETLPDDLVADADRTSNHDGGATLLYVGKIDKHRGVNIAVEAMPEILKYYPETRLRIIGSGTELDVLVNMTKELGLEKSVTFEGWLDHAQIPRIIGECTIGLIPHLRSEHTDTTIPNKIFDYMAMGKPAVVSNCGPLERMVREEKCGLSFRSGDSRDLSRKILQLLSDSDKNIMGQNGKMAVQTKYNWEVDSQTILRALQHYSPCPDFRVPGR